ncbi:hypothetical protein BHE74_00024394 [Ensete ventricosum]|nr:hypothetical protein BHE74_00024394 [Ensete ventricosum]RZR97016.1 hypothetical protein BHM03_00026119 [Ensete ventricosum]
MMCNGVRIEDSLEHSREYVCLHPYRSASLRLVSLGAYCIGGTLLQCFPLFSALPRNPTVGLSACGMAVRFLIPRASKTLSHHLLRSPPSRLDSIPSAAGVSGCLRALHSVASRSSRPLYRRGILPPFSRFMVSASSPRLDLAEAVSSALDIDSRVPATVITGFLGSGKVSSLFFFYFSISNVVVYGSVGKMESGLAKPSPVIETFCTDELVARYVKLDGVVTLVDCKHAIRHLDEVKPRWVVNEAVEQVAYADRIILNKLICCWLANYMVSLCSEVLSFHIFAELRLMFKWKPAMTRVIIVEMDMVVLFFCNNENFDHHGGHHHDHVHDSSVTSVSIVSEGTLDLDEVNDWLDRLVDEKGEDLYRMKGVVSVNDSTGRFVFQWDLPELFGGGPKQTLEKRERKLIKGWRGWRRLGMRRGNRIFPAPAKDVALLPAKGPPTWRSPVDGGRNLPFPGLGGEYSAPLSLASARGTTHTHVVSLRLLRGIAVANDASRGRSARITSFTAGANVPRGAVEYPNP